MTLKHGRIITIPGQPLAVPPSRSPTPPRVHFWQIIHEKSFRSSPFLKGSALAAGALSLPQLFSSPNILHAASRGEKVRCVLVGCGGRGGSHLDATIHEQVVALVDPMEKQCGGFKKKIAEKNGDAGKIETFTDYRRMFDKLHKQIDAVFVATPNHHHALPSMIAMQLGKGVYCEKPLCHDVAEARKLRAMAERHKVATQMGNQGHCQRWLSAAVRVRLGGRHRQDHRDTLLVRPLERRRGPSPAYPGCPRGHALGYVDRPGALSRLSR